MSGMWSEMSGMSGMRGMRRSKGCGRGMSSRDEGDGRSAWDERDARDARTLGWRCLLCGCCARCCQYISRCTFRCDAELHVFCRRSTNNGMCWGCSGDVVEKCGMGMLLMMEIRECGWLGM